MTKQLKNYMKLTVLVAGLLIAVPARADFNPDMGIAHAMSTLDPHWVYRASLVGGAVLSTAIFAAVRNNNKSNLKFTFRNICEWGNQTVKNMVVLGTTGLCYYAARAVEKSAEGVACAIGTATNGLTSVAQTAGEGMTNAAQTAQKTWGTLSPNAQLGAAFVGGMTAAAGIAMLYKKYKTSKVQPAPRLVSQDNAPEARDPEAQNNQQHA